jgi:pyruvate kinase
MLESMIEHPMPTRAESSDVANAIWDGTDAVMLSAESAAGKYPLESIRWLSKIATDADNHDSVQLRALQGLLAHSLAGHIDVSIASAACRTAKEIGAKCIVAFTEGGNIVRMLAHSSGDTPIIGATTNPTIARRIRIMRNVQSILIPRAEHLSELLRLTMPLVADRFDIDPGAKVVVVVGHPLWVAGSTNTVRVIVT